MMLRTLLASENDSFAQNGYVVIRQVLEPDEVERLRSELKDIWFSRYGSPGALTGSGGGNSPDRLFSPVRNVHEESELLRATALDERIQYMMEQIFGEEALVVGGTCFYKAPGSKELPMHQDNYDIGAAPGTSCAAWISLDRTSEENGSMRFVPRTHTLGLIKPRNPASSSVYAQSVPVPDGYAAVSVETGPGDIILFNGNVLHGSHANTTTDRFRMSYVVHYVGYSTERIFVQHNRLLNKRGERETRRVHKAHAVKRMFAEH